MEKTWHARNKHFNLQWPNMSRFKECKGNPWSPTPNAVICSNTTAGSVHAWSQKPTEFLVSIRLRYIVSNFWMVFKCVNCMPTLWMQSNGLPKEPSRTCESYCAWIILHVSPTLVQWGINVSQTSKNLHGKSHVKQLRQTDKPIFPLFESCLWLFVRNVSSVDSLLEF